MFHWVCDQFSQKRSLGFAHLFRPRYPDFLHGAPPTSAYAAFIRESRKKFANARRFDRKSGVRWGEPGHPSDSCRTFSNLLVSNPRDLRPQDSFHIEPREGEL